MKKLILGMLLSVMVGCGGGGGSSSAPVKTSELDGKWTYSQPITKAPGTDNTLLTDITFSNGTFYSIENIPVVGETVAAASLRIVNARNRTGNFSAANGTLSLINIIGNKNSPNQYNAADQSYNYTLNGNTAVIGGFTFTR